mgnify:FL=1
MTLPPNPYADLPVIRRRYHGRYLSAALILLALGGIAYGFAVGKIEWSYVGRFLTVPAIMSGLLNTVIMSILAMLIGIALGVIFAIMRLSSNPVLSWSARGYVWFFRAVPVLLQLLIWFNLALIFPSISIPGVFSISTVNLMTPFVATLLGLGIQQGAYTSEVVRAGLMSVDRGQYEAAQSIGMPQLQCLRRIVIPQAMRVIVPPIGNEWIGMVKLTSLASVIQYSEILHSAQNIYYANARVIELLIVASIWYLLIVTIMSILQSRIEKFYAKGVRQSGSKT